MICFDHSLFRSLRNLSNLKRFSNLLNHQKSKKWFKVVAQKPFPGRSRNELGSPVPELSLSFTFNLIILYKLSLRVQCLLKRRESCFQSFGGSFKKHPLITSRAKLLGCHHHFILARDAMYTRTFAQIFAVAPEYACKTFFFVEQPVCMSRCLKLTQYVQNCTTVFGIHFFG